MAWRRARRKHIRRTPRPLQRLRKRAGGGRASLRRKRARTLPSAEAREEAPLLVVRSVGLRPQISAEKHFKHPNYWKDRAPKRATGAGGRGIHGSSQSGRASKRAGRPGRPRIVELSAYQAHPRVRLCPPNVAAWCGRLCWFMTTNVPWGRG